MFTTVSSTEKVDFLKSVHNGPTDIFNYKTQDFVEEVKKATDGKGVDVVIDFIGGGYFPRYVRIRLETGTND